MPRYRVVGEYGIQPGDYLVHYCKAATEKEAWDKAIRAFKKTAHWSFIGEHNMTVEEVSSNDA